MRLLFLRLDPQGNSRMTHNMYIVGTCLSTASPMVGMVYPSDRDSARWGMGVARRVEKWAGLGVKLARLLLEDNSYQS